jgi:ornithine carbamoyltransferase
MNLIKLSEYSEEDIIKIVKRAQFIKGNDFFSEVLKNKTMYMLFQKTSTRTSLSFSMAMTELGGNYFIQKWEDSNFIVGEIKDEIRYVSSNVDIIMARLKHNKDIVHMSEYSTVPVINGCCDTYHPCQALADMLTIVELFGSFNIKMLYIGVRNNVFNSLLLAFPRLGGTFYSLTPLTNKASIDTNALVLAKETGRFIDIEPGTDIKDLIKEIDVLYIDTWVDMEFFNDPQFQHEKQKRLDIMLPYQVNEELLKGSHAHVMHDMPMHPGYEITRPVIEAHMGTILRQSNNRKHAQKAVIVTLLEDDTIKKLFPF